MAGGCWGSGEKRNRSNLSTNQKPIYAIFIEESFVPTGQNIKSFNKSKIKQYEANFALVVRPEICS